MHPPHDPLRPHAHDPNLEPPAGDPGFVLERPDGTEVAVSVAALRALPLTVVSNCLIVSTGHGTSGPFAFGGARLLDLIQSQAGATPCSQVEVLSADGFGNRVLVEELLQPDPAGPMLLAYTVDGAPLTREQGLVRLIVPSERDDALRQVKWVARIRLR